MLGGIFGAVIRGGVGGGDDHCDPRTDGRRGRPGGVIGGVPVYIPNPGGVIGGDVRRTGGITGGMAGGRVIGGRRR